MHTEKLVSKYPLISDQISKAQLCVILDELEKTFQKGLVGAVVEFGCYIGTTSLFIRRLLDSLDITREFHVYDSFEGLPPKSKADESGAGEQFRAGELAVSKKEFLRQFQRAGVRPPMVHKGWFKDLTNQDMPDLIAFAFLDGDFYESIYDSLNLYCRACKKAAP
jgi:O-methyltransferase